MKFNILLFRFTLFVLFFYGAIDAYAQQKQIDSLKQELVKFEAKKRKLGLEGPAQIDTVKIRILAKLVEKSYLYYPDQAMVDSKLLLSISQKIGYRWGIANAYNNIGVLHDTKSRYTLAIKFYKMSLAIKLQTDDKIGQIDSYTNIGVAYSRISDTPEALSNMMKALDIAKKIDDLWGIAGIYNNLGVVYMSQNEYNEALKNYFNCLKTLKRLNDYNMSSVVYQNIGEIYSLQKKPDTAMTYFEKGLKIASRSNNKLSMANNYSSIGKIHQFKKNYNSALQNYRIAFKLRNEIGDSNGISNSNITIGYVLFKLNDNKKAIEHIQKGIDVANQNGEMDIVSEGYKYLSEIYETSGNYKLAYKNLALYKASNDSVFNIEKEKKISQLQIKYNYQSMQDSIEAVQEKRNIIAKDEANRQKTTRNFIFFALGLIVLFLIILLIQRNKIAIIKRQKALEEERNRISRDLHDNLGAQLSTARMFVNRLKHDKETLTETIDSTMGLLDDSILELRKIMNDTHSSTLHDKGYLAATEELANKINQLHLITFTLNHHNMEKRPDFKIEHELYRVTQELVNNTLKYSGAKTISIDLIKRDGNLILMYEDDGKGFDIASVSKGNGLNNIEFRTQYIGGTIEFDSMPGAGSRTIVEIPLKL